MAAENVVITHVTAAAVAVAVINWVKASPYIPWITQEQGKLLRILAVITSGIGAIGIHYVWDPAAHSLTFTGLSLASVFALAVAWVKSFALQEVTYQATRKTNGSAALLKQILDAVKPAAPALLLGLTVLAGGCAVRHLPNGATQPATKFEQILAWNAAAAQANDGFADNVIALQHGAVIGIPEAKNILIRQATIAQADKRITDRISAAATCAAQKAGTGATSAQLDADAAGCARISAPGLTADINTILGSISDLNTTGLLAIKDPAKRQALNELLGTIQLLVKKIYDSLETQGVIQ